MAILYIMLRFLPRTYCGALLLFGWSANVARADFYLHSWEEQVQSEGSLHFNEELGYYKTDTNFDVSGNQQNPVALKAYHRLQNDLSARWGAISRLTFFGRFTWSRVQIDLITGGSGSAFGLGDQTLGANFRVFERKSEDGPFASTVSVQAQGDFPLYSNIKAQEKGTPFLGDSSTDLTAGAFVTLPFSQRKTSGFLLTGGAGYTRRSGNFSAALPWSFSARYVPIRDGFKAGASFFGLYSLNTDPNGSNATLVNSTLGSSGSGGSYMTNAINPSLYTFRGDIGWETPQEVGLSFSFSRALTGTFAPSGFAVMAGVQFRMGSPRKRSDVLQPHEYGQSNQGFVDYTFEAHVTKTNDRLNMIKIDKGSQDGVEMGQIFDFFKVNTDGTLAEAVARGKVSAIKNSEAVITITEYFKEVWIEEGFVAKKPLQ